MLSKKWPPQILLCISSLHIYFYCTIIHYMFKGRRMYLGVWILAHTLYFLIFYRKHSLLTVSAVSSEGWALQHLSFCYLCYMISPKRAFPLWEWEPVCVNTCTHKTPCYIHKCVLVHNRHNACLCTYTTPWLPFGEQEWLSEMEG